MTARAERAASVRGLLRGLTDDGLERICPGTPWPADPDFPRLTGWMRGRLVDAWLAEHQAEHGTFDEAELRELAAESGVPYLAPGRTGEPAA